MLHRSALRRAALPFEPMALSTLDMLFAQLQRGPRTDGESVEPWRNGSFFISPKHDGVRIVSFANSELNWGNNELPSFYGLIPGDDVEKYNSRLTTCFSRHGRPVWGMHWIEQELHLLRAITGDPNLIVDGELYLHKEEAPQKNPTGYVRKQANAIRKSASGDRKSTESSIPSTQMSGFLGVASLVNRLRGKLRNPHLVDVLQHVSSLPLYCLFDIASYSPRAIKAPPSFRGSAENSKRGLLLYKQMVQHELYSIQQQCLQENGIKDIQTLHVVPNVSPFTLRLRVLGFFASLLKQAQHSEILMDAFCPWHQQTEELIKAKSKNPKAKREKKKDSKNIEVTEYLGGHFVKIIPYSFCESLDDAQKHFLQRYVEVGYEGAVIRTPLNVYAMKEKKRNALATILEVSCRNLLSKNASGHTSDRHKSTKTSDVQGDRFIIKERNHSQRKYNPRIASALMRTKQLPKRSLTAVKLLLYKDDEFPILKPLFKETSTNPRTRQLVAVQKSALSPSEKVKKSSTERASSDEIAGKADHDTTVRFFGLQCLASNGRVFNVTLPKLSLEKQAQLLRHLQEAPRGKRSLVGLYATIKFSTLTEHGIPRFGTVKAIRGGKGWFM